MRQRSPFPSKQDTSIKLHFVSTATALPQLRAKDLPPQASWESAAQKYWRDKPSHLNCRSGQFTSPPPFAFQTAVPFVFLLSLSPQQNRWGNSTVTAATSAANSIQASQHRCKLCARVCKRENLKGFLCHRPVRAPYDIPVLLEIFAT